MAWGYHLVLDCFQADKELISNKDNIVRFAKTLVERIEMKAYGEPQVIHFGEDEKQGYTLVQLIETSNICCHFCDETGDFYLDVFSCKPYDKDVVIDMVAEFFNPKLFHERFIERG